MTPRRRRILISGLALLTILSSVRALFTERERARLAQAHGRLQQMAKQLETELASARRTLGEQEGALSGLRQELEGAQARVDRTTAELASLRLRHDQLSQEHRLLSRRFGSVLEERQALEAQLSSLTELKRLIRDATRKIWRERWAAWQARIEAQRQIDHARLDHGNRGYLVRNGMPTLETGQRMHVRVLEPQAQ